jgi:hypothetical protein
LSLLSRLIRTPVPPSPVRARSIIRSTSNLHYIRAHSPIQTLLPPVNQLSEFIEQSHIAGIHQKPIEGVSGSNPANFISPFPPVDIPSRVGYVLPFHSQNFDVTSSGVSASSENSGITIPFHSSGRLARGVPALMPDRIELPYNASIPHASYDLPIISHHRHSMTPSVTGGYGDMLDFEPTTTNFEASQGLGTMELEGQGPRYNTKTKVSYQIR